MRSQSLLFIVAWDQAPEHMLLEGGVQASLSITNSQSLLKLNYTLESPGPPSFAPTADPGTTVLALVFPRSQTSTRGEAKDTALLLSIDGYLLEPTEPPPAFPRNPRGRLGFPGPTQGEG